jgi:hypothetical protein
MFSFGASSGNSVGKIGLKNKTNSNNKKKWTRGVVLWYRTCLVCRRLQLQSPGTHKHTPRKGDFSLAKFSSFYFIYLFLVGLGFELRALYLPSRYFTLESQPQSILLWLF